MEAGELWSEGCRCLSWQKSENLVVDTREGVKLKKA